MSNNSISNNHVASSITVTPAPARFTKEEKNILYEIFHDNEDIIDIKHRRNSSKKNFSVRECWEKIVDIYNNHPDTTNSRNVKQIQKFWLNARLRKHYPIGSGGSMDSSTSNKNTKLSTKALKKFEAINVIEENIKFEKECDSDDIDMMQDDIDNNDMQNEIEVSTSSNDVLLETPGSSATATHFNIDHISAEKLTLTDLLEFKNSRSQRSGDEIVLQIKTQNLNDNMTNSIQNHHQKDNNLTGGGNHSAVQSFTTTSYRISNPVPTTATILTDQHFQTTPIVQQPQILHQQLPQSHHKSTQFISQPQQNCCTHNNNNNNNNNPISNNTTLSPTYDNSVEEKINFYRMKEAELKYKEEQLKLEQTKIELAHAKELLKNAKELHGFQIEEMKLKIRLLIAEEKKLNGKSSGGPVKK